MHLGPFDERGQQSLQAADDWIWLWCDHEWNGIRSKPHQVSVTLLVCQWLNGRASTGVQHPCLSWYQCCLQGCLWKLASGSAHTKGVLRCSCKNLCLLAAPTDVHASARAHTPPPFSTHTPTAPPSQSCPGRTGLSRRASYRQQASRTVLVLK